MAATKATELAQLSRKLTYNEGTNVASIAGTGDVLTTANTSDNLPVGSTNLYHTTALARAAISATSPLAYNATTGVISTSAAAYTNSSVDTHLNQSGPTTGYVLSWNGSDYAWVAQTAIPSTHATQAYVTTQINALIDSSPAALNTLNELAAALGDDASFSTTITALINTKTTAAAAIDEATALAIALG